jgi:hypothetical protein
VGFRRHAVDRGVLAAVQQCVDHLAAPQQPEHSTLSDTVVEHVEHTKYLVNISRYPIMDLCLPAA